MKAILNQILLLPILGLFLIILSSCENEVHETILSDSKIQSEESIRNFRTQAHQISEGKILKNNEKMPIQDAINYISNTFNYEYCFPLSKVRQVKKEFVIVKIPIIAAEGKTYLVDALSAYNESVAKVRTAYKGLTETGKHLICIVVKPDTITSDTLYTKVYYNIGFGNASTSNYPYDNNEQYWYTENGGNCSEILPPQSGDGAPIILMNDIKAAYAFEPAPGAHIYYVNCLDIDYLNPVNYPNAETWNINNDNFCDYMFYYAKHILGTPDLPLSTYCLGVEPLFPSIHEMDYYYNSILERVALDVPTGREFVDIYINSESEFTSGYISYFHCASVTYGMRRVTYYMDSPISIEIIR